MSGRFGRSARIAVAAVGGAVLVIVVAAAVLVHIGTVNVWLTSRIADLLGPRVQFRSARALWWPLPGVVLDHVEIVPAAGTPVADITSASSVTCRVRPAALLSGRVAIAAVRIEGLRVTVARGTDGRIRAGGLDVLALANASAGRGGEQTLRVPAVRVRDGEIVCRSEGGGAPPPLRLQRVDASFSPSGGGGRFEVAARLSTDGNLRLRGQIDSLASLDESPFTAQVDADRIDTAAALAWFSPYVPGITAQGRLRLSAKLSGRGARAINGDGTLELSDGTIAWNQIQASSPVRLASHGAWDGTAVVLSQGQLNADGATRETLAADTIEAAFGYADRVLRVDSAAWRSLGGTWQSSANVQLGDPVSIDASIRADGVDGTQVVSVLHDLGASDPLPQFNTPLQLSATAKGPLDGTWTGNATIATSGAVAWSQAVLGGPLAIAADLRVDPPRGGGAALVALSNGHAQLGSVVVDRLTADGVTAEFSYAKGAVRVAPLAASALGGAWKYRGTLPIDTATRWSGQLAASRVSAAALYGIVPTKGGAAMPAGTVDLSAQLSGTGTSAANGTATVRLASDALTWDALRIDRPAEISAALRLQGTRLVLNNGQARAQAVRFGELAASSAHTRFNYADNDLRLSGLEAIAFGGSWKADGALALAATPGWKGTVNAMQVDLDTLLDRLPGADDDKPHSRRGRADLTLRVDLEADGDARGSADVRLSSGSFIWDELRVDGPAHANGTFAVRNRDLTIQRATAEAAHAAYGPVLGHTAAAAFEYIKDRLTFSKLQFQSCDGQWTHSGWFGLDEGAPFAGQIAVHGAEPREVLAMFGNTDADVDFASLDLDGEFDGRATDDWLETLRASGSVLVRGGTMRSTVVLRAIWEALVGSGRVMSAMDEFGRRTALDHISATFVLRKEEITTPDLSLRSDDYNATAVGTVGLDGSVEMEARIQLTSQGAQKMIVLGSMPLPTGMLPSLPPIPTYITGDLMHPIVRPRVSALPAATLHWLVESLIQTPTTVGGVVVDRLGDLWNGTKSAAGAVGSLFQ